MNRQRPGYFNGEHFSFYIPQVEALLREDELAAVEALLIRLIESTEDQADAEGTGVSPWFYRKLAEVHHKQHHFAAELQVLQRYAAQVHAEGVDPEPLLRLRQARLGEARRLRPGLGGE